MLVQCKQCEAYFDKLESEIRKHPNHFCTRKCSAIFNNTISPKRRAKIYTCKSCGIDIKSRRTYCVNCNPQNNRNILTAGDIKRKAKYQKSAQIRGLARAVIKKSGLSKSCSICGYSEHVEVCHIKPIKDFLDSSLISEINSLDNLILLCPNHHWELDRRRSAARSAKPTPRSSAAAACSASRSR